MKLSIFLSFFGLINLIAGPIYSQNTKISLNMKDAPISSVLNKIEEVSEFYFLYNSKLIDVAKKVDIVVEDQSIGNILNEILPNGISVIISDRQIVLTPTQNLSKLEEVVQQQSITGKVTDATSGEALAGVNVFIEGTQSGALTDINGNFTLPKPKNGSSISFSFIGYLTQKLVYNGENVLNIKLAENIETLEEVVVVGYGTQKKSNITGSISQVKVDEITNRPVSGVDQALQGKTSGVLVINSSYSPGASPTVRIRGFSSNASSDPLYVVDGLRVSASDIGRIDPTTIKSMEVLKDAASAAIYGAQAGNGVVLITTKSGSKAGGKLTYDMQYAIQSLSNVPKVMNAEQYINYYTEAGQLTQNMLDLYWDGKTNTNWADVAFENSVLQRHTLQFDGATDKGSFFASASYLNNDGIVVGKKDTYKRYAVTVNADYNLKPWIKITANNSLENVARNSLAEGGYSTSVFGGVLVMDPLTPVYRDADHLSALMTTMIGRGWSLLKNADGLYYSLSDFNGSPSIHPLFRRDITDDTNKNFQLRGTLAVDITPFKGFKFTSKLGYNLGNMYGNTFSHKYYYNDQAYAGANALTSTTSVSTYYQWENYANYSLDIGDHNLVAMVGTSYSDRYNAYTLGTTTEITKDDPAFQWLRFATSSSTKTVNGIELNTRDLSYFGRLNYSYKGIYMLQASIRADAGDLSTLAKSARWGYFPAFSAGWVISKEGFMSSITSDSFSFFKLRGSWGQNGSISGLSNYMWQSSIAAGKLYPLYSTTAISYVTGSVPSSLGNEALTWETSEQLDFGFDARFFNDKVTFSFDWFKKMTKNLIISNATPSLEVGNLSSPINGGDVSNKGLEFDLGWRDKIGDFSYSIDANLATINNKVTYLTKSVSNRILGADVSSMTGLTAFEAGYPVWYFRGYKVTDIDDATGNAVFEDVNKDGTISSADMTYIGSAIPDFTYGVTINLGYKGFDFAAFGTGSQGNQIYNQMTRVDCPFGNKLTTLYDDRWTATNTGASRPKPMSLNYDKYTFSNALVFDASFFKIKQIQIGYSIPSGTLKKIGIASCRAYISLDDYFTITSYPGMDPETAQATTQVSNLGIDRGNYPSSKKSLLGFQITF